MMTMSLTMTTPDSTPSGTSSKLPHQPVMGQPTSLAVPLTHLPQPSNPLTLLPTPPQLGQPHPSTTVRIRVPLHPNTPSGNVFSVEQLLNPVQPSIPSSSASDLEPAVDDEQPPSSSRSLHQDVAQQNTKYNDTVSEVASHEGGEEAEDEDDDGADLHSTAHRQPPPIKRKRARKYDRENEYDVDDAFIDDSELFYQEVGSIHPEVARSVDIGFFVWKGPARSYFVQEGLTSAEAAASVSGAISAASASVTGSSQGVALEKKKPGRPKKNPNAPPKVTGDGTIKKRKKSGSVASFSDPMGVQNALPIKPESSTGPAPKKPKAITSFLTTPGGSDRENGGDNAKNSQTAIKLGASPGRKPSIKQSIPYGPSEAERQAFKESQMSIMKAKLEELKTLAAAESFEVKKHFPPILRPVLTEAATAALLADTLTDDAFVIPLKAYLPYNTLTLRNLCHRQTIHARIDMLKETLEQMMDGLRAHLLAKAQLHASTSKTAAQSEGDTSNPSSGTAYRWTEPVRSLVSEILQILWKIAEYENELCDFAKETGPRQTEAIVRKNGYGLIAALWPSPMDPSEISKMLSKYRYLEKKKVEQKEKSTAAVAAALGTAGLASPAAANPSPSTVAMQS